MRRCCAQKAPSGTPVAAAALHAGRGLYRKRLGRTGIMICAAGLPAAYAMLADRSAAVRGRWLHCGVTGCLRYSVCGALAQEYQQAQRQLVFPEWHADAQWIRLRCTVPGCRGRRPSQLQRDVAVCWPSAAHRGRLIQAWLHTSFLMLQLIRMMCTAFLTDVFQMAVIRRRSRSKWREYPRFS